MYVKYRIKIINKQNKRILLELCSKVNLTTMKLYCENNCRIKCCFIPILIASSIHLLIKWILIYFIYHQASFILIVISLFFQIKSFFTDKLLTKFLTLTLPSTMAINIFKYANILNKNIQIFCILIKDP